MSWHNHDTDEFRQKFGHPSTDSTPVKESNDGIDHDVEMLKRLSDYELTEKQTKMIKHIFEKIPQENKEKILLNYIGSLIGSAILHYDKKYVQKRDDIKVSPWD